MTAVAAFQTVGSRPSTTRFERALLRTAAGIDTFVAGRLERRSGAASRAAQAARQGHADARRAAEALGAAGIMPR